MLSHVYQGDYEVAYLLAGDDDYVPLVEAVRGLGAVTRFRGVAGRPRNVVTEKDRSVIRARMLTGE
jgi:hypothetical protein